MARLGGVRTLPTLPTLLTPGTSGTRGTSRRLLAASLAAATLGGSLVACGGQSSSSSPKKASSGGYTFTVLESTPGFFDLPLRVAIADFAPKRHLDLKISTVTGGGSLATEFQGGTGSVAMVGADTTMRLAGKKAVSGGLTVIGSNMTHMVYALVSKKGSKYHGLSDLKNTNVGITGSGSASEVLTKWALKTQAHLSKDDVHLTPLGAPPTILAGVRKGSVSAGTVFSPALEEGLNDKSAQITYDFRDHEYAQNVFMARTKEVKADAKPYKLFMQAYNDAVNKLESDPAYALANARKYWGKGTTDATLKQELDFFLKNEWKTTDFPRSLYDTTRGVLLSADSGFTAQTFPSYQELTQNAPKLG